MYLVQRGVDGLYSLNLYDRECLFTLFSIIAFYSIPSSLTMSLTEVNSLSFRHIVFS